MHIWIPGSDTGDHNKMSQLSGDIPAEIDRKKPQALAGFFLRLLREKPLGVVGGSVLFIMLFAGIFANLLTPYGMNELHLIDRFAGPSSKYLIGADQLGRDILTRMIHGARISVIVGLGGTSVAVVVAALIGVPSGYFGGRYDMVLQRIVDALVAFPTLLILLTLMSTVGRGMIQIILVMGILHGIATSRITRSAVIGIKENDYFQAAKAIGITDLRLIIRYVMPNIMAPLIVMFTVAIGSMILWEASLSFLGFGLPPDVPSWGGMLNHEGRLYMEMKPALALWPGLFLTITVYSINMFGDAIRDLLDPRLRGGER